MKSLLFVHGARKVLQCPLSMKRSFVEKINLVLLYDACKIHCILSQNYKITN